jgi:hypothetical protein
MKRQSWQANHHQDFIKSLGDDLAEVKREVQTGAAHLFEFAAPRLCVITRVERAEQGLELVIVAAEGKGLAKHWETLLTNMKGQGFVTMRIHAIRSGIVRLMKRRGFVVDSTANGQTILYKALTDGLYIKNVCKQYPKRFCF